MFKTEIMHRCSHSNCWTDIPLIYYSKRHKGIKEPRRQDSTTIPLILTSSNGVYLFLDNQEDTREIYESLLSKLGLTSETLFCFTLDEMPRHQDKDSDSDDNSIITDASINTHSLNWKTHAQPSFAMSARPVISDTKGRWQGTLYLYPTDIHIFLEDAMENIENFYWDHRIPLVTLGHYVFHDISDYLEEQEFKLQLHPLEEADESGQKESQINDRSPHVQPLLSSEKLASIDGILSKMQEGADASIYKNYRFDPDGTVRVRKKINASNNPFFSEEVEYFYPCFEEEGDLTYLKTLLGGCFGFHKFCNHKWLQGGLYLATCGMCGIFYVSDLIAILTGNYHDTRVCYELEEESYRLIQKKERLYARPVSSWKKWILTLPMTVLIVFFLLSFVYRPIYQKVTLFTVNYSQSIAEEKVKQMQDDNLEQSLQDDLEKWLQKEE